MIDRLELSIQGYDDSLDVHSVHNDRYLWHTHKVVVRLNLSLVRSHANHFPANLKQISGMQSSEPRLLFPALRLRTTLTFPRGLNSNRDDIR